MNKEKLLNEYNQNGYVIIKKSFSDKEILKMQQEADSILELIINSSSIFKRKSGRLDILQNKQGINVVRKIQPINDLSLYFYQVSFDERLIIPLRKLMKEEPILMEEKLNYKQPLPQLSINYNIKFNQTDRFPIHNDWAYYKQQNYPQEIISSAFSIDECNEDSGPLHIWPGSHKKHHPHESVDSAGQKWLQVKDGFIDPDGGIDILMSPGSIIFFSSLLVHNSRPNISGNHDV